MNGNDQFANQATISVSESAANTLTFKKLETGIALFEKVAWLISRIEYYLLGVSPSNFNSTDDALDVAITVTDVVANIADLSNPAVVDFFRTQRVDFGTAASAYFIEKPRTRDFSTLPGGGLLIPPNPIYLGLKGSGLAAATDATARIYYTTITLKPEQYWELVEARRIISS